MEGGAEGSVKIQTDLSWLSDKERIQLKEEIGTEKREKELQFSQLFL